MPGGCDVVEAPFNYWCETRRNLDAEKILLKHIFQDQRSPHRDPQGHREAAVDSSRSK